MFYNLKTRYVLYKLNYSPPIAVAMNTKYVTESEKS